MKKQKRIISELPLLHQVIPFYRLALKRLIIRHPQKIKPFPMKNILFLNWRFYIRKQCPEEVASRNKLRRNHISRDRYKEMEIFRNRGRKYQLGRKSNSGKRPGRSDRGVKQSKPQSKIIRHFEK